MNSMQDRVEPARVNPLMAGTQAPDFTLPATNEQIISLSDFRDRPVVLVFYPADHSPVCSNQLVLYNEAMELFAEYDAQLLGISPDTLPSHKAFAASLNLSFPLLADAHPAGKVAQRYGVYNQEEMHTARAIFVIDPEGVIRWSYVAPIDQNPGAHGILNALERMS